MTAPFARLRTVSRFYEAVATRVLSQATLSRMPTGAAVVVDLALLIRPSRPWRRPDPWTILAATYPGVLAGSGVP
jgi:hypothetical protein